MIESKSAETANDKSNDYALLFLHNPINLKPKPFNLSPEMIFPSHIAGLIKIDREAIISKPQLQITKLMLVYLMET